MSVTKQSTLLKRYIMLIMRPYFSIICHPDVNACKIISKTDIYFMQIFFQYLEGDAASIDVIRTLLLFRHLIYPEYTFSFRFTEL